MDVVILATTAYALAKPFLDKTAEGIASSIGEDIWNLIKMPFLKKGQDNVEAIAIENEAEFTKKLTDELNVDNDFASQVEKLVTSSQSTLAGNFQQNINSYEKIEKQINIQNNSGDIQM